MTRKRKAPIVTYEGPTPTYDKACEETDKESVAEEELRHKLVEIVDCLNGAEEASTRLMTELDSYGGESKVDTYQIRTAIEQLAEAIGKLAGVKKDVYGYGHRRWTRPE